MSETAPQKSPTLKTYVGGCHCGAVRFEAEFDLSAPVNRCNCTVCTKMGGTTTSVPPSQFRVTKGESETSEYRVGDSPNYRRFCKHCGVQCYGGGFVEEMGGHFRSINLGCLDGVDVSKLTVQYWDGRYNNWEAGPSNQPFPLRATA
ncbi:GFA family protein [Myxococcus qinghaiensis]|uniref:GFA family protein n=1 Tax=Myxococcus qinghaiensis TaxID=2906758 RepID=UPI0020A71342|nr:GFA family protein [Myxococcus qinghaiensis]MCP3168283.1 GFA family protein [Myxococcus qinghaiensis]